MGEIRNTYEDFLALKDAGVFDPEKTPNGLAKAAVTAAGGMMLVGGVLTSPAHASEKIGETKTHVIVKVEKGDTVWGELGKEGFGPAEREEQYGNVLINGEKRDVNKVRVGDEIAIPKKNPDTTENTVIEDQPVEMPEIVEDYVAVKGDYVIELARKWGVTKEWIIEKNPELAENPDLLREGQVIKKPLLSPPPAYTPEAQTKQPIIIPVTVQPGDKLDKIAEKVGSTSKKIAERNGIKDPNKIFAGQVFEVEIDPDSELGRQLSRPREVITVQSGQVLGGIAVSHNTSVEALAVLNNIQDPNKIKAGMQIVVPANEAVPVAPTEVPQTIEPEVASKVEVAPVPDAQATVEVDQQEAVAAESPVFTPGKITREWNIPVGNKDFPDQAAVDAFKQKVEEIAAEVEINPDHLMAAMAFETAGTFSPSKENMAQSGATGLIQFMPKTAEGMGTSTEELAKMSPLEQLEYVRAFFLPYKGRLHSLEDVYLRIFYPAAIGKGSEYILPLGGTGYRQNKGLDLNKDGSISVAEITAKIRKRFESAPVIETAPEAQAEVAELPVEEQASEQVTEEVSVEIGEPMVEEQPVVAVEAEVLPAVEEAPAEPVIEAQAAPAIPEHLNHPLIDLQSVEQATDGQGNLIEIVRVGGGDHVNVEIALPLAHMIEAAKADGIELTVYSGYRSVDEQIKLRELHGCGGDLIYNRSCKGDPNTAIPGRSNHNSGLAVDLRVENRPDPRIRTQQDPAFKWLKANAAEYGFKNYEPEPWHWSPNGR